MKIAFIVPDTHGGQGGVESVLITVVEGLKKKGVECDLFLFHRPQYEQFMMVFDHSEYIQLPSLLYQRPFGMPQFIYQPLYEKYLKKGRDQLAQSILAGSYDAYIVLNLAQEFAENYDFFQELKNKSKKSLLSWHHVSMTNIPVYLQNGLKDKLELFDEHLVISQGNVNQLKYIYQQNNISLVYNPVLSASALKRNNRRFVFIGRISRRKRVYELIKILKQLKGDWHLDFFGAGAKVKINKRFEQFIKDEGLEKHITFHGWSNDPWQDIKETGVLLLHSITEGLPLVLIEAMMRGVPCVSADCETGPSDIIQPGVNGWLYDVHDEQTCLKILQNILDEKKKLPSVKSVQQSVQKFEAEHVINNIYDSLVKTINKING